MTRKTALDKRNETFARRWALAKARHKYAADRATLDRIRREMEAKRLEAA